MTDAKRYRLLGPEGLYQSETRGTLGGYGPDKLYGRFDCPSATRAIERGGYVKHRVFFADEATAIATGFRPCAKCLPHRYRLWREDVDAWRSSAQQITNSP